MAVRCPICTAVVGAVEHLPGHIRIRHNRYVSQPRDEGWFCRQLGCRQWFATYHGWRNHYINNHFIADDFGSDNVEVEEEVVIGDNPGNDDVCANDLVVGVDVHGGENVQNVNNGVEGSLSGNGDAGCESSSSSEDDGCGDGDEDSPGSSGSSSEEDIPVQHDRYDVRKLAADMIVELRSNCLTTREDVTNTIRCLEKIIKADHLNIKRDLYEFMQRYNLHTFPDAKRLLSSVDNSGPFDGMRSKNGQRSIIKEYLNFIPPVKKFLGQRVDRINVGQFLRQRPVRQSFQYVSLTETLKLVMSQEYVSDFIGQLRPNQREYLQFFCDGETFQNNEFLMRHPATLLLLMYYDEVDVCNSQGSKSGIHMMALFYLIILNVPQHLNATLPSIHLIAVAFFEDILEGGFQPVLQPFLDELANLESEEGMRVVVKEQEKILRAVLIGYTGDSKSAHLILGFIGSGARHFCRLCMISRDEHHAGVALGQLRNRELHAQHVARVEQNINARTLTGVKEMSCLNNARFFHCTENFIFDVDHDLGQGVIPMEIRLVLKEFICVRQVFTAHDLNRRLRAFNYGLQDIKNKPSANFTADSLANALTSHSMKQTMSQTYCLLRALPFLLDNFGVGKEDRHLRLLVLLQQIVEIVLAPKIYRGTIQLLNTLIVQHMQLARQLFDGLHIINKYHHMQHYADCIVKSGPLRLFRTIRPEGKHRPLKRHIVTCGSYRDVPTTSAELAQISQAKYWGSKEPSRYFKEIRVSGRKTVRVGELECANVLVNGGFDPNDVVFTLRRGSFCGTEFRRNEFVIVTPGRLTPSGLHKFGRVQNVISANDGDDLWLEVKEWETEFLDEHLNAYVVSPVVNAAAYVVDTKLLPLHPCINQDIGVTELTELSEDDFRKDFPMITVGQRKRILKIIGEQKQVASAVLQSVSAPTYVPLQTVSVPPFSTLHHPNPNGTESIPWHEQKMVCQERSSDLFKSQSGGDNDSILAEEMGCDELNFGTEASPSKRGSNDCTFTLKKRKKTQQGKGDIKVMKPTACEKDGVPDVKRILRDSSGCKGQRVIDFILENEFLTDKMQSDMLQILKQTSGHLKAYPSTKDKCDLAQGIVASFPCLADANFSHKQWFDEETHSGLIQTKLAGVRRKAPPEERKNRPRGLSKSKVVYVATSPNWKVLDTPTKIRDLASATYMDSTAENQSTISALLASTYQDRRKWVLEEKPTATRVVSKFRHLLSYGSLMISEEFNRLEPDHTPLGHDLVHAVPAILKKSELEGAHGWKELKQNFKNAEDSTKAIVMLPSLLYNKVMKKDQAATLNEGAAFWLRKVPSSALLQIVPEGTDVDSYKSVEIPREEAAEPKPVPPFILWVTKNRKEGEFYIKVDGLSIHVNTDNSDHPIVDALETLIKVNHVFNLNYHPYLASVINFLEHMMHIKNKTFGKLHARVNTLLTFIRTFQSKEKSI